MNVGQVQDILWSTERRLQVIKARKVFGAYAFKFKNKTEKYGETWGQTRALQ